MRVKIIVIQPLVKKMLKFLHTYKGKNANTVIDNRAYDATEAIRLIKEAKSAYDVRVGTANTILNVF